MLAASRSRGIILDGGEGGKGAATTSASAMKIRPAGRGKGRRKAGRNKEDKRRDTTLGTSDGSADDIVVTGKNGDDHANAGIMDSNHSSVRRRRERLKQIQRLGCGIVGNEAASASSRREAGGRGYDRWRSSHCNHVAPSWRITASTATQRNPHGIASATRMRQGDAATKQVKETTNNRRSYDDGCGVAVGVPGNDHQQETREEGGSCNQNHAIRPSQPSEPPIPTDQTPSPPIRRSSLSSISPISTSSSTIASQHSSSSALPSLPSLRTSGGRAAEVGRNVSIGIDSNGADRVVEHYTDHSDAGTSDDGRNDNLGGTLPSSLLPSSKSTKRRNVAEAAPQNTMNAMAA